MADTKKVIGKVSLTPRGAYDPAAAYTRLDVVQHDGCGYIVLTDNIQGVTPEDGVNYMLLASGTEIDDTLTVSGKAADAAAVGARLSSLSGVPVSDLKSILTNIVTFLKSVPFDDTVASASDLDAIQTQINALSGSSSTGETISISYDGTTATISGLASVNVAYSGTTAMIGG